MRKRWTIGLACGLLAVAASFAADLSIGDTLPNWSLTGVDQQTYSLAALKGKCKGVAVVFISTQCPVSNAYNDRMQALYDDYRSKGIYVFGINSNKPESMADVKAHAKENGFKFAVLKDTKSEVDDAYDAGVTPEIYIADGDLKLKYHGAIDNNQRRPTKHYAVDAIKAVLAGQDPEVTETPAQGCSIKD